MFKEGLAYEKEFPINWCPSCKTGLANEEVVNGIAFPDKLTPEELQQAKEQWRALLEEKSAKTIEQQGGIASFEILSEEISEDGNSATVTYKQVFGNGTEDDGTQKMVKKEGKWLMDINK